MCEGEHCLKMHGQRNDAYHKREMHFLKFHKSVTQRGFLQFLNFNFGKMASPRGHATSTQSLGPSESLRSVATPSLGRRSRMEKHVSRAVKGKSMKKKVEPETLEEHIVAGGALMFVRVWHARACDFA